MRKALNVLFHLTTLYWITTVYLGAVGTLLVVYEEQLSLGVAVLILTLFTSEVVTFVLAREIHILKARLAHLENGHLPAGVTRLPRPEAPEARSS